MLALGLGRILTRITPKVSILHIHYNNPAKREFSTKFDPPKPHWPSELAQNPTFQALGSGIYWMVTVNVVVWMVAPLVAVTVRG
jgi:hypothetical protein